MTAIAARAESSIGSLYQFFPTKEQVARTLLAQHVAELLEALDKLSHEAPALDVSVVAGRLTTLFATFRTTHPAFEVLTDAHEVTSTGATEVRERLRQGIASVLAALDAGLSAKEGLLRAAVVQHLMKAAVTLSRDATVSDPAGAMLELQRVVQHYLEDVMEIERRGRQTGLPQRTAARKRSSASSVGTGLQRKGKPGVSG